MIYETSTTSHQGPWSSGDDLRTLDEVIRFEVLGPLQVSIDGRSTAVGPPQQQTLLALLLTSPNRAITTDRIVEEMWSRDPPPSARHLVHVYVSRLRELLGEGEHETRIVRGGSGYAISAHPEEIDAMVLEASISEADDLRRSDPSAAARRLHDTTALWRGRPFGDLGFESPLLTAEAGRLEELYLEAMAGRIGLDLEIGDHREVILQLEQLTEQHPYREAFWAHLMLALYRCGRQAEALQTYQTLRRTLVEELGSAGRGSPGERVQRDDHR